MQGCNSQATDLVKDPSHSVPPLSAGWLIFLLDVFCPTPHVAEHSDHSSYDDHLQFTQRDNGLLHKCSIGFGNCISYQLQNIFDDPSFIL